MGASQSLLCLIPGPLNVVEATLKNKRRHPKKAIYINELPFVPTVPPRQRSAWVAPDEGSAAAVPDTGGCDPVPAAQDPDRSAKFPVISASYLSSNTLLYRYKCDFWRHIQARKPRKYPVTETRSPQTASTANKINDLHVL